MQPAVIPPYFGWDLLSKKTVLDTGLLSKLQYSQCITYSLQKVCWVVNSVICLVATLGSHTLLLWEGGEQIWE